MRYRFVSLCASMVLVSLGVVSCSSSGMTSPDGSTGGTTGTGGSAGSGGSGGGSSGICATLENYVATAHTAPSFAKDIYPIISSADTGNSDAGIPKPGCAQASFCHGSGAPALNATGTTAKYLVFTDPAATVKTNLLASSVNAPALKRVDPGHVATSFMAYKLSGMEGLACISSSCVSGASIGTAMPCGDAMPSLGNGPTSLSATDRTLILDWIALGAAD